MNAIRTVQDQWSNPYRGLEVQLPSPRDSPRRGPWYHHKYIMMVVLVAVLAIIGLSIGLARSHGHGSGALQLVNCSSNATTYPLQFFVIGDWGREGNENQRRAAELMAAVAKCQPPQFIISTGDNFYPHGMNGPLDTTFTKSFTSVYSAKELQVPWHAVLGNHDYTDTVERDPVSRACMVESLAQCPGNNCCYSPLWQYTDRQSSNDMRWHLANGTTRLAEGSGLLDLVLYDSNPFIKKYRDSGWAKVPGGLRDQNTALIKAQLVEHLRSSSARFKVVVGHHPVRSYGQHCHGGQGDKGDCEDLDWVRQACEEHKVHAYFNGHDHDQQHVKSRAEHTHYIISGAGSDTRTYEFSGTKTGPDSELQFADTHQGFVFVGVTEHELVIQYYTSATGMEPAHVVTILPHE